MSVEHGLDATVQDLLQRHKASVTPKMGRLLRIAIIEATIATADGLKSALEDILRELDEEMENARKILKKCAEEG